MSRLGLKYLGCILSGALVVALLGSAAAYSGHRAADIPDLLARVALLMVAGSAVGAHLFFRPVERYLAASAESPPPAERIRRLPLLSASWVFVLAAATVGGNLGTSHGGWRLVARADLPMLTAMLLHVLAFATYVALYIHFLVREYAGGLRAHLWKSRGILLPAGRGRIAVHLVVGIAAVAAAPLLLFFSAPPNPPAPLAPEAAMHHALLAEAMSLNLLAAALFTVALAVLIARGISRPMSLLVEAMERVDRGDLRTRAPIVSDDELGMLAARFNRMLDGLAERETMRRIFGRLVPEEVARSLIAERGAIEPQEREATVLFTDIEGFTRIGAGLEPREVLSMLNEYFDRIAAIIHRHAGAITQFQGDAVLAVFNLPSVNREHALSAVKAAIEIARSSNAAGPTRAASLRTRVGVSTGKVVGGTVAGGDRLGYTVHGDTVNLAARLEEMNKETGSRVLIDGRTAERIAGRIPLRDRGRIAVRGFPVAIPVFEPLDS